MQVKAIFNEQQYIFTYNEQTGYYEADMLAPESGGIYQANITITDNLDNITNEILDVQVWKKEEVKRKTTETIAYFLDKRTFKIKDILILQDYDVTIDEETNAITIISIVQRANAEADDFVFIKENDEIIYMGIVKEIQNENGEKKHILNLKYISNLFDRDIIVDNEALISSTGIEDFLKYTIENEFTQSQDTLLNINFLDVEVKTHTKINKSIPNENGIYNFHTYITNCSQNYNIVLDFKYVNKRLKLTIYKEQQATKMIDATLPDISNYVEVFKTEVTAKVRIKTSQNVQNWYLLNDRTTTQDISNQNRAIGKVVTQYTENAEDAYQTAMNVFKGNSYNHLIEFALNGASKLINVNELKIGTPIKIKTNNNIVLDTYISAINIKKGQKFRNFKTGNIRINFIEKLKKGERK